MNRAGKFVNNMPGDTSYQSFCPNPLPPVPGLEFDEDMLQILVKASRSLKQLDVSAQLIPNAELFISMYVRKEALMSSQMEGTQCTLDDILDPELDTNANLDTADVVNYVKAAQYALTRLHELPICNRLFREAHAILLEGVRGQEKNPGEFRRSQNWIGPAGCGLKDARYIPPNPEDMVTAMSDLEKYINENQDYDPLVKLHEKNIALLPKPKRKKDNLRMLFDYLEKHPIIDIKHTSETLKISYNTTSTAVKTLVELGILRETTNAARNRVFSYEAYLEILRNGT